MRLAWLSRGRRSAHSVPDAPPVGGYAATAIASSRQLSSVAGVPTFSGPTSAASRASVAASRSGAGPDGRRMSSCVARTRAGSAMRCTPTTAASGGRRARSSRTSSSRIFASRVGAATGTSRTSRPRGSSVRRSVSPAQARLRPARRSSARSRGRAARRPAARARRRGSRARPPPPARRAAAAAGTARRPRRARAAPPSAPAGPRRSATASCGSAATAPAVRVPQRRNAAQSSSSSVKKSNGQRRQERPRAGALRRDHRQLVRARRHPGAPLRRGDRHPRAEPQPRGVRLHRLRDGPSLLPGRGASRSSATKINPLAVALDARREGVPDVAERRRACLRVGRRRGEEPQAGAGRRGLRGGHAGTHAGAARLGVELGDPRFVLPHDRQQRRRRLPRLGSSPQRRLQR